MEVKQSVDRIVNKAVNKDMDKATDASQWTSVLNQCLATFAANIILLAHGLSLGWGSPAIAVLSSENSPLPNGALSSNQISWIGSINCCGGLCGCIFYAHLITRLGSKQATLLTAIPVISFWLLVYYGNHFYYLLIARFISGFGGGGMLSTSIMYISEIASDSIRGRLASMPSFFLTTGCLIGYILGAKLQYHIIPCISVLLPLVFVLVFTFVPNTPQYYILRDRTTEAENALKFYKGYSDSVLRKELEKLKNTLNNSKTSKKIQIKDLFNRKALKGLGVGVMLGICSQFTANFVIMSYAVMIFQKIGTSIDPNLSAYVMAISMIFGALTSTYLSDSLGRKWTNFLSFSGSAVGLFITAGYYYINLNCNDLSAYQFVPVAALSFVIFISSAGIVPLVFICTIELMPKNIRTTGLTIMSIMLSFSAFLFVKAFPVLLETQDVHGCLMIYSLGSLGGAIFVLFAMKETSGKSLDDAEYDDDEVVNKNAVARSHSDVV